MKIPERNIINIQTKHDSIKFPAGFEDGKIYSAKIVERTGKFSGLIEISGKKLTAEFTQGLPRDNILNLKAEIAGNGKISFKIIETQNQGTFKNALTPFTILSAGELESKLFDISRMLSKNISSVFEINARLIGNIDLNEKNRLKNLTEKLLVKGLSRENVKNLISVISGTNPLKQFLSIFSLIGNKTDRLSSKQNPIENIKLEIDSIISQITEKFENPEEILLEIADLLKRGSDPENNHSYSFFIDDNEELNEYEYIFNKTGLIINADFSVLGKTTIIIQDSGNILHINIITETNNAENIIRSTLPEIKNSFAQKGIKCSINIITNKNVLDKLNVINRIHQLNNILDIKI